MHGAKAHPASRIAGKQNDRLRHEYISLFITLYSRLQNPLPLHTHMEFFFLPVEQGLQNLASQKLRWLSLISPTIRKHY